MTTELPPQSSTPKSSPLGIPLAIVIAGGLIAAALYLGGGKAVSFITQVPDANNAGTTVGTAVAPTQLTEPAVGDVRAITDSDHIRGAANAKVTVVEYVDLECPFCKRFHPTLQQLIQEYPNDVRWVYRHFPLEQLHSKAPKQAEATECAGEQGKFWEFTDKIFEVTPSNDGLDMSTLPDLARQVGVPNIQQFQSCLDSGKYADHVAADLADAQTAGGRGTPYSVVIASNGEKFPINGAQPYASVKQVVDKALGN